MEYMRRQAEEHRKIKEMEADIIREGKEQENMYNKKIAEQKIEEEEIKKTKDDKEKKQLLNENQVDGINIDEVN